MKILIADDSKTTRALLVESLKKLGHEVLVATNGQEAIDIFQSQHPDLLILDVIMEGIDGFECAKRIRSLENDVWIPIIFLSGAVDDENIAKGINAGGDDYLTKPYSEITLFAKIKAMQRISDMRSKLYEMTKKLSTLSSTDVLTGIYNRLQFDKSLKEKMAHADRYNQTMALLFLDLDNFKTINDTLGHYVGDLLLQEVAKRLDTCLRIDDFLSRIGGDEFAIILTEVKNRNAVIDVAQKIIKILSEPYNLSGNNIQITASIGIAIYPSSDTTQKNLVQNSDIAMYYAKESGGNRYQFYTEELSNKHDQQVHLENELKYAMERHELCLTYQPIYNLQTRDVVGMEALLSWKHPELGLIPPATFIPLAEEIGLIDYIGKWVLRAACEQAAKWYLSGYKNFKLSVNLSPRQLLQKNLPQQIADMIKDTKLPAKILELELTETSPLIYSTLSEVVLKEINEIGIKISLDDFGTGYSSLTHLKRLPISAIKIDKSFIHDVTTDPNNMTIVKSMISLSTDLGFNVIAEGIETETQLQFLIENKCPLGQGFYLSKPLSTEQMTQLLEQGKISSTMAE